MPSNDSSTGGYLSPSSVNGDLNDAALADFLQRVVVGITGLPGQFVRPRWQPQPPNIPPPTTNWAAIGVIDREDDPYPFIAHSSVTTGSGDEQSTVAKDTEVSNEILSVLVSFYGPSAEANSQLLKKGFKIAQNREQMQLQGYAFVNCDPKARNCPEEIAEQYVWRTDIGFRVRHQQIYDYPVLDVASVAVSISSGVVPSVSADVDSDFSPPNEAFGLNRFGEDGF